MNEVKDEKLGGLVCLLVALASVFFFWGVQGVLTLSEGLFLLRVFFLFWPSR